MGFKCGQKSLLMRDGVAQRDAARFMSSWLASVYSSLLGVVLHLLHAHKVLLGL